MLCFLLQSFSKEQPKKVYQPENGVKELSLKYIAAVCESDAEPPPSLLILILLRLNLLLLLLNNLLFLPFLSLKRLLVADRFTSCRFTPP